MKAKFRDSPYLKRIALLRKKMGGEKIDLCLVTEPLDLFYFTGLQLSVGHLFVHRTYAHLFVDGRYCTAAKKNAPVPVSLYKESDIKAFLAKCKAKRLGFDSAQTPYDQAVKWAAWLPLVPLSALFKTLRMVKEAREITRLRASARLLYRGFEQIRRALKEGISELEVARAFEIFCLEQGAEKLAFEPIIAFGENTALPHHRAGKAKLCKGDPILIDIGVVVDRYHSDMTRMFFYRKIDPFLGRVYEVVRKAQRAALALCKPGVAVGALDEACRRVMREQKMESAFMHSLGHGIGLATHEAPRIKWDGDDRGVLLEPGMVITIEPGLYFPKKGGVRYEDTVVITEKGYRNFFPEMKTNQLVI